MAGFMIGGGVLNARLAERIRNQDGLSYGVGGIFGPMLGGKLDAAWARWSRPWTHAAWIFLTLGIALGSWWAYYELGWGGWWFWDPVENASFMPWLVGTALIHSQAVTEKRGAFGNWTLLLALSAFSLSLLGTFLVRSGVLTSVHAFASDPTRGVFILAYLAVVVGGSLALYAARAPKMIQGGGFTPDMEQKPTRPPIENEAGRKDWAHYWTGTTHVGQRSARAAPEHAAAQHASCRDQRVSASSLPLRMRRETSLITNVGRFVI